jgi:ornithine cyclodeaminase/alanine dehydrogenase-like protein (mu-crystallin family)
MSFLRHMRYLSSNDLFDLLSPQTLIAAVEEGLREFSRHEVIVPPRQHVRFDDGMLLSMPVIGRAAFGAKIVSVVPSNAARGLPVTNGLMTLSDRLTGVPLAVLNAASLTAQRTGAVSALSLKYMTPREVDSIGVIGTGVQGVQQAIFACAVRDIKVVHFTARSDEKAQRFVAGVARRVPRVQFSRCVDASELLSRTEVIIAASTSATPVMPADPALLKNKHFVSVGSFRPSMQELPSSVYQLADQVVVDSDAAKSEVGDLIEPLSSGLLREENIVHLADLVSGRIRIDVERTSAFKSVGLALYDLYAAQAFVAEALRLGRGTVLEA